MTEGDSTRMTFGQHLDELRGCVIRALLGVGVVAAGALVFQTELFEFFVRPYEQARAAIRESTPPTKRDRMLLATVDQARRIERLEAGLEGLAQQIQALHEAVRGGASDLPPAERAPDDPGEVPDSEESDAAFRDAGSPSADELEALVPTLGHDIGALKSVYVTENFMSHIKVALLTACLLAAPWVLFQMWTFIGAGLYTTERRTILRVLPISIVMFLVGMTFGYLVLVPIGLEFLLSYGSPEIIEPTITVSSYLGLLFVMLFVMGLVFQIPLIMTVVGGLGLIDPQIFRTKRKHFLLGCVVAAALLTPPDYMTQLLVAAPMFLLYEVGILMSVAAHRRKKAKAESSAGAA